MRALHAALRNRSVPVCEILLAFNADCHHMQADERREQPDRRRGAQQRASRQQRAVHASPGDAR